MFWIRLLLKWFWNLVVFVRVILFWIVIREFRILYRSKKPRREDTFTISSGRTSFDSTRSTLFIQMKFGSSKWIALNLIVRFMVSLLIWKISCQWMVLSKSTFIVYSKINIAETIVESWNAFSWVEREVRIERLITKHGLVW
jgi:hypothetical protein